MSAEELVEPYLARIAADWIAYFSAPEDTRDGQPALFNPFGVVCELVQHSPLFAWDLIHFILAQDKDGRSLDVLAAGPLEDFISAHGSEWIEDIEESARGNPRFRSLLAGTCQLGAPDDVWARIVATRGDAIPFQSQ